MMIAALLPFLAFLACPQDEVPAEEWVPLNRVHLIVNEDCITIGKTSLLFTMQDFTDRESALSHFKKVGERIRPTIVE